MSVLPSQAVSITFRTKNIDGELADATGTITAVLYRNGAATMVAVTVASITGTGRYSASWTNAGYAASDQLEVEVTATIGGTAYTSKIWSDSVVAVVVAPDNASITAIKAKTDNLPASPAAVGSSMVASNMRGTDGANTTTPPTTGAIATAVWDYAISSATTAGSIGKTLLDRITGLLQTKAQADTDQTAILAAISSVSAGGGGDATLAKQGEILAALGNVPSSGSGARRVVISVVDYSAAAVVGAKVTIQTAAGATIAGRFGNTIAGGLVIFNLDDGDYKGRVTTSSGYDAHTAQAFTVDEDDEPVTLTIMATSTSTPDDPSLCRLTVGFVSVHGLPIVGATVTPSLSIPPELVPSGYALNESDVETTDSSGGFTADFIQGITVQLNVDHEGKSYRVQIKIPALQTYAVKLTV